MKMVLLTVGATDIKAIVPLIEQYAGRIGRYVPFELAVIPDPRNRGSLPKKSKKSGKAKKS